jgi:hypothetical protein
MIAIAIEHKPTYMPVSTSVLTQLFGGLMINGLSSNTDKRMLPSESKTVVTLDGADFSRAPSEVAFNFDFPEIEKSFDCEFVEIPEEIQSAKDFRKWIMEMNLE